MTFEAVIFDRDGVLLDFDLRAAATFFQDLLPGIQLPDIEQHWRKWGEKVGFPRSLAEERDFFHGFWNKLCDDHDLSSRTRQRLHQFDYTTMLCPYPDARPALQAARQSGLRVGVLSNFSLASIEASLEAAGLMDLVDIAYAAPVIGFSKPDPRAYLTVTEALGVKSQVTLFFDDESEFVEGARALGMTSYWVDRSRSDHDLCLGLVRDLTALSAILSQI